jgi:DNA-binding beta-propeller fold protein YncE
MHPQIAAFPRLGGENTPPVRTLEGQKTLISRTMHGFAYDEPRDEIVVMSPLAQAVLVFRGGANGEEPPVRVIQGPHTQIQGTPYGANDKVSIDPVNNEIYVPAVPNSILVFDMTARGDVPPKRILRGVTGTVAVDPIHNLLIVAAGRELKIFDRTVSGDATPKAVISGPRSNLRSLGSIQVTSKGWIITGGGDFTSGGGWVGAWSINDNGDVPPHWKIPVQQLTGYDPYSLAIDPAHKEMLMAAAGGNRKLRPTRGVMNAVVTFSWPEIF